MKISKGTNTDGKNLASYDVWALAFGCMIGWGVFVMPGTTFLPIAGPAGTVISMIIGTLLTLVIGYNFSYMINRNSRPGGVYSYTKEAFGREHAFLSLWFLCLSYLTVVFLNATAIFVVILAAGGLLLYYRRQSRLSPGGRRFCCRVGFCRAAVHCGSESSQAPAYRIVVRSVSRNSADGCLLYTARAYF